MPDPTHTEQARLLSRFACLMFVVLLGACAIFGLRSTHHLNTFVLGGLLCGAAASILGTVAWLLSNRSTRR